MGILCTAPAGQTVLAAAATPFADGWATTPRSVVRVIAGLAFLGLGGLLTVLTFILL